MEQITIIKRDGTTIAAYSQEPFCTPTSVVQSKALMSDDTVKITLRCAQAYSFGKGDKIVVNGEEYKIRTQPERVLQSDEDYIYNLTFYGVMYDLMKCQYRNCDANGNSTKATFDLTYSLLDFAKVIIYNMNRDNPNEWALDENNVPVTEPITINFSKQNCLQVLQSLCSEDKFNTEFRITQNNGIKTIHIGSFGSIVTPPSGASYFEWGKGNGLFTLTEKKVDDKAIITRLWAEGGTQNIKSGYRDYSDRLQFPYPQRTNARAHTLSDGTVIPAGSQTIGISNDSKRYMEDTSLSQSIGVEEDTITFDDIYPKRTGVVSSLGSSIYEFVDNSMDFDLNETDSSGNTRYLIAGTSAKITFTTGLLAGQEFELSSYTHSTKTFKIKKYTDERGLSIPTSDTSAFRIAVGDKYKITDINMPDNYVQAAEEDLWYKALDYFMEAKQARVNYDLEFDRMYFLDNMPSDSDTCVFKVGDYVPVKDTRFGIEKNIRIQKVTRNLMINHDYSLTLSDTTAINVIAQTIINVNEHETIIQANNLKNLNKAKRGWRTTEELRNMVYDTDGYFDNDNIRPNSIDTNMLTVGSKSQQFVLTGVVLTANKGGNPNVFSASAGVLSHLTINDDNVRLWNMSASDTTLTDNGGYYVFAKCSKNGNSGVWYITQSQIKTEPTSDQNNYYFQVGIIGSLLSGFRDFTTTYGFTRINGNTITTGKIVTSNGNSYLDLDGDNFKIGDSSSSLAWNENGNGKLVLKGTMIQTGNGSETEIGAWCGVWSNSRTYAKGDEVAYTSDGETKTYRYIYSSPSSGKKPTDYPTYWMIVASGASGSSGRDGYNQATIQLYKRSATPATIDWTESLTYNFTDGTLSPIPNGWDRNIPASDGNPCYVTAATARSTETTDTIANTEFTPPIKLVEDGIDGFNTAVVRLYKRSADTPSPAKPTGNLTYKFNDGTLIPQSGANLNGWSLSIPQTNGQPCWTIQATAFSQSTEDTIPDSEWSTPPVKYVKDGEDGEDGIYEIIVYKNANERPPTPTGNVIPPEGWRLDKQLPASTVVVTSVVKSSEEQYAHFDLTMVKDSYKLKCNDDEYKANFIGYCQINFTTSNPNEIVTISMLVSSEANYDFGYIALLDSTVMPIKNDENTYNLQLSGNDVRNKVDIAVETAGTHYVRIWYKKDRNTDSFEDCVYFSVIDSGGGKIWQSTGTVQGDAVIQWTQPIVYVQDPPLLFQGEYEDNRMYYGNATRRDVVRYNDVYYIAHRTAGSFVNILPTNAAYWGSFGGSFQSVATGLLFAELAYIENAIIRYLQTQDTGRRIEVFGNIMKMYDDLGNVRLNIEGRDIDAGTPTVTYPINKLNHNGRYRNVGGELITQAVEMVSFQCVAGCNLTIPQMTAQRSLTLENESTCSGSVAFKFVNSDDEVIYDFGTLSFSGQGTSSLSIQSYQSQISTAGVYRIMAYVSYNYSNPNATSMTLISLTCDVATSGSTIVITSDTQLVSIGANGLVVNLGESCYASFIQQNGAPSILIQAVSEGNIIGLKVDANGVKYKQSSQNDWEYVGTGTATSVAWGNITGKPNVALQQDTNDFISGGNEFNFAKNYNYNSGRVWFNYQGSSKAITDYFFGNGVDAGALSRIKVSGIFVGNAPTGNLALADGSGSISQNDLIVGGVKYKTPITSISSSTAGWYRICELGNRTFRAGILHICREYAYTPSEVYTLAISCAYQGNISITQLSGTFADGCQYIQQIRIVEEAGEYRYIDVYCNDNTTHGNGYYFYGSIDGDFINPTKITSTPTYVRKTFQLGKGVVSDGFRVNGKTSNDFLLGDGSTTDTVSKANAIANKNTSEQAIKIWTGSSDPETYEPDTIYFIF